MIFGKTKLELKVGIFVFLGLLILVVFVLSIGGINRWTSGYHVDFVFNFVNGIKVGAPVRFAGVGVGEVRHVKLIYDKLDGEGLKVKVTTRLKKSVRVPLDSTVWVNTLGLLGEKYIEIMPGKDYSRCLMPDQSFDGIDPIAMHEVFRLGRDVVATLNDAILRIKNKEGTMGKLFYDDKLYYELEGLIEDIRKNPWKLFWKTKEKK